MIKKTKIILLVFTLFFLVFPCYSHEINKEKIEKIIQNFLNTNPELIQSILEDHEKSIKSKQRQETIKLLSQINNPSILQKDSDITIYEFFDYNCGYCKSVVKTIMDVLSEDKKVNFVFVELPILSQNSYTAAKAALASEKQGLYINFHLSLMKIRGRISEDEIFNTAKKSGLNLDQLKIDMKSQEIENKLKQNREVADLLKLNGTPGFLIGDIIYPGAMDKFKLKQIIKKFRKG